MLLILFYIRYLASRIAFPGLVCISSFLSLGFLWILYMHGVCMWYFLRTMCLIHTSEFFYYWT